MARKTSCFRERPNSNRHVQATRHSTREQSKPTSGTVIRSHSKSEEIPASATEQDKYILQFASFMIKYDYEACRKR